MRKSNPEDLKKYKDLMREFMEGVPEEEPGTVGDNARSIRKLNSITFRALSGMEEGEFEKLVESIKTELANALKRAYPCEGSSFFLGMMKSFNLSGSISKHEGNARMTAGYILLELAAIDLYLLHRQLEGKADDEKIDFTESGGKDEHYEFPFELPSLEKEGR